MFDDWKKEKQTATDHDIEKDFQVAKSFLGVVPQEFNFNVFATPTLSPAELIPIYDAFPPPVRTSKVPVTVKLP